MVGDKQAEGDQEQRVDRNRNLANAECISAIADLQPQRNLRDKWHTTMYRSDMGWSVVAREPWQFADPTHPKKDTQTNAPTHPIPDRKSSVIELRR